MPAVEEIVCVTRTRQNRLTIRADCITRIVGGLLESEPDHDRAFLLACLANDCIDEIAKLDTFGRSLQLESIAGHARKAAQ